MKLKPYYLGLVLLIMLGLTASSTFGVGSAGTVTGGTFPACVDPANTNPSTVKIAGKQVAPGGLVHVPVGTTCTASETTLNLNSYLKTILVSPSTDNATSGINLKNALNSATGGTLVKVEPGTYDLVTTTLTMKQGVNLEGSGEGLTIITSQVGDGVPPTSGTILITSSSEIRFLTIANTGNATGIVAVYGTGVNKTAKLTNVTASASGSVSYNYGIYLDASSSPTIVNSTITAIGGYVPYGIYNNNNSSPTIINSTISASGSTLQGVGIYNKSSSSPTIQGSSISASGANNTIGLYNDTSATPTIQNSTISASGGSGENFGMYNFTSSSPIIQNSTISGNGGSVAHGMFNDVSSSPAIQNSNINATNGTANYSIYNNTTSSPTILNSVIAASNGTFNYSVFNNASGSPKVAGSQLVGVVSGGSLTCINSYNASFVALSGTCT